MTATYASAVLYIYATDYVMMPVFTRKYIMLSTCSAGMFRCRKETYCILQSQVCDGKLDCPQYGDDEALCNFKNSPCPLECQCFGDTISCVGANLEGLPL